MSQCQWTYIAADDTIYQLGLYHGDESGHLMLHCNEEPLIIDFSILESKEYHFYLEQEMLTLKIDKKESQGFTYELMRDDQVVTPFTKALHEQNRRYNLYAMAMGVILIIIIFLSMILLLE